MAYNLMQMFIMATALGTVIPHRLSFSRCPVVDKMENFSLSEFLGKWFIIESDRSINICMTLDFEDQSAESTIKVVQRREILPLHQVNIDHISKYEGIITLDESESSAMTIRWPANIFGSASFYVLDTDYKNYALLFECQKMFRFSRRAITILSRNRTLDSSIIAEIKNKIAQNRLDASSLNKVSQTDCITESESDFSFTINEETFGGQLPSVDTDILDFFKNGTEEDFARLLNLEIPENENLT